MQALVSLLGSMWADVKVAALHAVSMCMQRDVLFRADVAQVGAGWLLYAASQTLLKLTILHAPYLTHILATACGVRVLGDW